MTKIQSSNISDSLDLSSKTVTLPAASVTDHVAPTDTTGLQDDIALLGFKVASSGALAKYNLVDQTEDSFVDQTGIDAGESTSEIYNATNKYYSGNISPPTGGAESTYSDGGTDYVVRSFLSGTTDLVFNKSGTVDYLLMLSLWFQDIF